jgi:cadmium resistance protein CadD (predicted permease)
MNNLMMILLFIFIGVALMVVLGERFASPADPARLAKIQRWLLPLVGLSLVLSLINHYWA